jgi:hypothetical protein
MEAVSIGILEQTVTGLRQWSLSENPGRFTPPHR